MRAALHLGDITKICGYDVPPVDCVIGGSPCQDLSIAGKREGLAGARSGLFMEQIRIVKEMREADRLRGRTGQFVRPRYMVWENVPGAFSSSGGDDFRAVLEETIRIAEPDAPDVPLPPKGKWPLADAWYGDGWSVAYRVLDAQFWGVPQRRRRIALVADFGGQSAPEILFERESVSWHTTQSGEAWQGTTTGTESGAETASGFGETGVGYWQRGIQTLRAEGENRPSRPSNVIVDNVQCLTPWNTQSARVYGEDGAWHSLNANENGGMSRDSVLTMRVRCGCEGGGKGALIQEDKSGTLACNNDQVIFYAFTQNQRNEVRDLHDVAGSLAAEPGMKQQTFVCAGFKAGNGPKANGIGYEPEKAPTLSAANSGTNQVPAVICLQGNGIDRADTAGCNGKGWKEDVSYTLNTIDRPAVFDARGNGNGETVPTITGDHENRVTDYTAVVMGGNLTRGETESRRIYGVDAVCPTLTAKNNSGGAEGQKVFSSGSVRRLTPVECERLQGFPDNWTDIGDWTDSKGKVHQTSDAARYKAMGNSIALPPWKWVLKRLCACYERDATMASLFDGVGGFPLIWERLNGPGTCLWASEIEPFCVAVTTRQFNKA